MNKYEFLTSLKSRLEEAGISNANELIDFYEEAISDRIEAGMSEEDAVASIESIDTIVENAKADMSIASVVSNKIKESHDNAKKKGHGALWITLAIIGAPLWFPLLIAAAAIVLSIYVVFWSLIVALYAVEFAFAAASVACFIGSFSLFFNVIPGITALAAIGFSLFFAGLAILLWNPLLALAKGCARLAVATVRSIKKSIIR